MFWSRDINMFYCSGKYKPIRIHDFPAIYFDWLKRIKDGRLSCDNFIIFVHSFVQTADFQEEEGSYQTFSS